ncbi:hypothetical protein A9995_08945 [Erythrobacter sp. QSSC1-22B]|uniref:EAL domain-containing protein n=1 Tax=Erythrobacter sp. QSSC1-22B TaxID=1860125 RepID=UPI000804B1F3|nr:EAL domain-containing protein [Erythrobacter sp. QSSC1-22B]OBX19237.1 hypothetical protein A9995_08945 [Erythrobacter sp. QSSC1-22B]
MGISERVILPGDTADSEPRGARQLTTIDALRDLRQQYSCLLTNLPGVVYRSEAEAPWFIAFISKRVRDLTGRGADEFESGLAWERIVHPDDLNLLKEKVEEASRGPGDFTADYRLLHADGSVRWVRDQAQVVRSGSSKLYLEGFIQDVTPERELEHSARAAQDDAQQRLEALQQVLEGTNDCVYSLDRDWRISYTNSKARSYFGEESLLGKPIMEVFTDERSPFQEAFVRAMDLREGSEIGGFLESRQNWYELRVVPTPGGITVFFRDTTEQQELRELERKNAERWKASLNTIPQMVWSMAGDARQPDFYNDRWYEFTGLPLGSVAGPKWIDLFHPDDREKSLSLWRRCRETGEPYEAEYRLRDRNSDYRWVASRGRPEIDSEGSIVRWYGTCTDVHERLLGQLALQSSEAQANAILNSIPQIIWCADSHGNLDFISDQWPQETEGSGQGLLGGSWLDVVHPEDRSLARLRWKECVQSGDAYETAFRLRQPSGDYLWTLVRAQPEQDDRGGILRWFGTCTDIHEQIIAQQALQHSEQLNRGIVEASPDCMSVLDAEGTVLYVNSSTVIAYGVDDANSLVGRPWGGGFLERMQRKAARALKVARGGGVGRLIVRGGPFDERWYDIAVAPITDAEGGLVNFVVISRDFTERKRAEEKAQWAANHDSLTKLPNRFLFHRRLEEEIAKAAKDEGKFALLLFDLDYLKSVNDGMGYDAGDALLQEIAARLSKSLYRDDVVARLGGDEFGVLLSRVQDAASVERMVDSIKKHLAAPFAHGGTLIDCQGSLGAAIFPLHGRQRTELMKCADVALYSAKKTARGQLKIFDPSMRDQVQRRLSMLSLARSALQRRSLAPHYQPKISLVNGSVCGFEALMRWQDSNGRLQLPLTIAAAFDDVELATKISDRMMEAVLEDVAAWLAQGVEFGHVALNAGSVELRRDDFVDVFLNRLAQREIPPNRVQLEVTETVFLGRGGDRIAESLSTLSKEGVKLALDDFGTGYASLSHLKQYPVDTIKIDRSFVQDIQTGAGGQAIIEAIIGLGKNLEIEVVAEGIETPQQHKFLHRLGCEFAQGFLYSAAIPAIKVPGLLDRFPEPGLLLSTFESTQGGRNKH